MKAFVYEAKIGPVDIWWSYLCFRPHLVLPFGFDEIRFVDPFKEPTPTIKYAAGSDYFRRVQLRHEATGAWYAFRGIYVDGNTARLTFAPTVSELWNNKESWVVLYLDQMIEQLEAVPVISAPKTIILPTHWWSPSQQHDLPLTSNVCALLQSLCDHRVSLNSISWRELEEIIGELLRKRGLQVYLTPRTRDGGRDIVARGELIPGEPSTIAIEVKHKSVVGLADIQRSLYANRNFPALLLATSGRFSAGVIAEKKQESNQLRLILKDGTALMQWINDYAFQTGLKADI